MSTNKKHWGLQTRPSNIHFGKALGSSNIAGGQSTNKQAQLAGRRIMAEMPHRKALWLTGTATQHPFCKALGSVNIAGGQNTNKQAQLARGRIMAEMPHRKALGLASTATG